ncbi:hypothetical protein GCM10020000_84750 [Streptomyces olivoverticillatus]
MSGHTLLGSAADVAASAPMRIWTTVVDHARRPFPGGHALHGTSIVPASTLLHTFLETSPGHEGATSLFDVDLRFPLALGSARQVQVVREGSALRLATRPAQPRRHGGVGELAHPHHRLHHGRPHHRLPRRG